MHGGHGLQAVFQALEVRQTFADGLFANVKKSGSKSCGQRIVGVVFAL